MWEVFEESTGATVSTVMTKERAEEVSGLFHFECGVRKSDTVKPKKKKKAKKKNVQAAN